MLIWYSKYGSIMHRALITIRYSIFILTLFVLASCGGKKGELRIKGKFAGLNNADLVIFSRDGLFQGIDTLHVRQEEIDWSCPCSKEQGSLTIVYPTYSTLTVFGGSGDVIEINGNAKHLSDTKVGGNADNEAYTLLRKQMEEATPTAKDSLLKAFMDANPESPVTRFLHLENLARQTPEALKKGEPLPDISIVTRKGDTVTTDTLKGKYTLLAFWANWRGGTTSINSRIRRLIRQAKQPLVCLSYNLDVGTTILDYIERTDTMTWHCYSDQKAFQSDLVYRLGVRDVPFYVLADTAARIIVSGTDWQKDIEPELEQITSEKTDEEKSK
ncbi:MAG: redoxin domain-containing protein [Bacteroidaceae bacterium]|nr:redoxin domain-containing protein [Bacteroidaceae bacterium]